MSIATMSLTGGVFILAVLLVRALFQNIVPRRTFLALWLAPCGPCFRSASTRLWGARAPAQRCRPRYGRRPLSPP